MVPEPSAARSNTGALPFVILSVVMLIGGLVLGRTLPMTTTPTAGADHHDGHEGHAHGADDPDVIDLSPQARRNIGLEIQPVKLENYDRTVAIPGIVRERPGRSVLLVAAPLTGFVSRIHVEPGQAVKPGQILFDMRLSHEELVQAQADLLKTAGELEVTQLDLDRLEKISSSVAGKQLIELRHELHKLESVQLALEQSLVLHGLSKAQVAEIIKSKSLLQTLAVRVPEASNDNANTSSDVLRVQQLLVSRGEHVEVGKSLIELADHSRLIIEGNAFEKDLPAIQQAVEEKRKLAALIDERGDKSRKLTDLEVLFVEGRIDPADRMVHFYTGLPNEIVHDEELAGSRRIDWKYRPGQRVELLLPVDVWKDQIVVPANAVAQDGVETYVFQESGTQLRRREVHVRYRDPHVAVIANDGSVFPGDRIAFNSAQQLMIAIKNKSGGAIDPHAGHNH